MLNKQKGTILVITLGVILVVVLLSAVIVSFMLSQSRLTKHQVDRTRARYAAQAGVNYALEMLRVGRWFPNNNYTICNVTGATGCGGNNTTDTDMPFKVEISIGPANDLSCANASCINATVNYTYTP
ncbi:MAG: hypothetical protein PHH69_06285 [Candidatus Omnitrophica bacterium]|nr:hypothetical protein [Candidatus Omnitrophota bacterium]MDD5611117.1 hypothetical protein [Candidatus Omnitrophota bacterium]